MPDPPSPVPLKASYAGSVWTDTYIKAVVPNSGLTVGTTYKVTVTTPGGY